MKKFNKTLYVAGMVAATLGLGSCVGDLDLLPSDPNQLTPSEFPKDPKKYMDALIGDVYLNYATYGANGDATVKGFDGGMSTFQRAAFILEEIPSDETNWLATADVDYGDFQYGIVPSNNRAVFGTYSRFMINVTLCNDFIQTIDNGYFGELDAELTKRANEFKRQARILRAGSYFYLIDCFGNAPYADENTPTGTIAPQLGRAELFNRIVADLEAVVADYKANPEPTHLNYVGVETAQALLVKYYLNAGVYTGTDMYDKALRHAQDLIATLGHGGYENSGLVKHYNNLFGANNDQYAIGGASDANEIIWYIPQANTNDEGQGLLSYANGDFMINGFLASSTDDSPWKITLSDYNTTGQWKCMTARTPLVEAFDWLDDEMSVSADSRTKWWLTSAQGFTLANEAYDQDHYGQNGYIPLKYTNWAFTDNGDVDRDNSPAAIEHPRVGYAMIRLAEIYLSAAEAILKTGGDKATALTYVNYVRGRAGLDPWTSQELTETTLRGERQRELYTECCRRTDLIRYGLWTSGYNWDWKNKTRYGADFASNFDLYPIPSQFVDLAGYQQNPNY